jgi:hypothetical protein
MKKLLLLFASVLSLLFILPFSTHAEDSSSSGSAASSDSVPPSGSFLSPHEPTEDHTTGSVESTESTSSGESIESTSSGASTESTGSTTSSGSTEGLSELSLFVLEKLRTGEITADAVVKYTSVFAKLQFIIYIRASSEAYSDEEYNKEFERILRGIIKASDKAIASKKYNAEKTSMLTILRKWASITLESGITGIEWRTAYIERRNAAMVAKYGAENLHPATPFSTINFGSGGTTVSDTGSVVCTELHRQGLMSDEWYAADSKYGRTKIDSDTMAGYHSWGIPLAKAMRESPTLTAIVKPLGLAWAEHMAYEMGATQEDNALGATMQAVGVPINRFIGQVNGLLKEVSDTDGSAGTPAPSASNTSSPQ